MIKDNLCNWITYTRELKMAYLMERISSLFLGKDGIVEPGEHNLSLANREGAVASGQKSQ